MTPLSTRVAGATKLTKAQIKALADLDSDVRHGFRNANLGNRTAEALCRLGFVTWEAGRYFGGRYRITEAGRRALSSSQDSPI